MLIIAATAVIGIVYAFCFYRPIWDVDVFWHIKAGQWITEHRTLPSTDIFSAVDPTRPWHTFQWGYEVLVYGLDQAGGLTLVRAVHAAAIWSSLALLALFLWRRTSSILAVLLGVVPVLVGFADRIRCRPDAFNLLFTVLALPVLLERRWRTRHILWLLALTIPWANLHGGGVLLLFILIAGRGLGLLLEDLSAAARRAGEVHAEHAPPVPWRELGREAVFSTLPVLIALAMPGFARGVYQAFFQLGPSKEFIPEWMNTFQFLFEAASTWHERVAALGPLIWLLVLVGVSARRVARNGWHLREFHWRLIGLAIPLGLLGLEHVRFVWLGGLIATLAATAWVTTPPPRRRLGSLRDVAVIMMALFLGMLNIDYLVNHLHGGAPRMLETAHEDLEPGEFPVEAADFLVEVGMSGGVLNHAPWGGYLLYRLWPEVQVYTDGRGNFSDIETHALTMIQNAGTRRRAIDAAWKRGPFNAVVHPKPFPCFDYRRFFWILVYRDEIAWVYLRNMPENDPLFERVRAWYEERGVDLSGTSHEDMRAFELERRIRRYHGLRLFEEPWIRGMDAEHRQAIEEGSPATRREAWYRMANLYFDLGLQRECRLIIAEAYHSDPGDPRLQVLLIRSLTADGSREEAQMLAEMLTARLHRDATLRAQMSKQDLGYLNILRSHLGDVLGQWIPPGSGLDEGTENR